jgi:hypothetical protein
MTAKIITAEEVAEHYAPLLDLHGALLALEEARAENERLKAEVQELMDELAYHGIYPNDLAALEKQPVVRKARYFNRYLTDAEVDEQVAQMRSEK